MNGSLGQDPAGPLIVFFERHRGVIVATVAGSFDVKLRARPPLDAFVERAFDTFAREIVSRDAVPLDAVVSETAKQERGFDVASVASLLLTTFATALDVGAVPDHAERTGLTSYCARRSTDVVRIADAARGLPGAGTDDGGPITRDDVVSALVAAMDAADPLTGEHLRAVGSWCGRLAATLGLSAEAQRFANLCGTLHDIGKLSTPSAILCKPTALDDDEWVVMRGHARAGATVLERIPSLREVAPIVRAHHERIDGRGYPDGQRGGEIPLIARLVAAADAFHAMISRRPYRDPMSVPEAAEQLIAGRGTQWDAVVVDAIIGLVRPVSIPPEVAQPQWGRRRS